MKITIDSMAGIRLYGRGESHGSCPHGAFYHRLKSKEHLIAKSASVSPRASQVTLSRTALSFRHRSSAHIPASPCEDTCGISLDNNGFVQTGNDLPDANMLSISLQTSVEGISPMAMFARRRPRVSRRQWVKAQSGSADTGVSVSRLLNKLAGCSETAEERKKAKTRR